MSQKSKILVALDEKPNKAQKILHRDLWQYKIVVLLLSFTIIFLLHGIGLLVVMGFSVNISIGRYWYVDIILSILLFVIIWKVLDYRFFNVVPSASYAYDYDDGPWLHWRGNPKTSITINWYTKEKKETKIEMGDQNSESSFKTYVKKNSKGDVERVHMHHITLQNLEPDNTYYYRVVDFGHDAEIHSFTTAPEEHKPFNFVVLGDTQNGGGLGQPNWAYPILIKQIMKHKNNIDLYMHVGDFTDQGNDLRSWHAMWDFSKHFLPEIPLHIAVGNHDGGTHYLKDPDMKKYPDEGANFDYFLDYKYGHPSNSEEITPFRGRYFSFRYSNCHFLFLDTKERKKSEPKSGQWEFIRRELEKVPDDIWKIVFIHRPQAYIKDEGKDGYGYVHNYYAEYIVPLLDKYGVDIVFQGHSHYYLNLDWKFSKSSKLWNRDLSEPPRGENIHFVTTGAGGNELRNNVPLKKDDVDLDGFYHRENSSQYLFVQVIGDQIAVESRYAQDDSVMHKRVYKK